MYGTSSEYARHVIAVDNFFSSLAKQLVVVVREHNQKTPEDALTIKPVKVVRHAGYNENTFVNDIALIQLREPVRMDDDDLAGAACLPDSDQEKFVGTDVIAAGWGRLSESKWGARSGRRQVMGNGGGVDEEP